MQQTEIETAFAELLANILGTQSAQIERNLRLDKLGFDSISKIDLAVAAEDRFGIAIPDYDLERFVDVGDQSLKNIARPVRAYRFASATQPPRPKAPARKSGRRVGWIAGAVGAAAALAGVYALGTFQHPAPAAAPVPLSLFSSWRMESKWASSLAFSLLPRVDCRPVSSPVTVSRMLCRRLSMAAAEVPAPDEPVGMAAPNTVLYADSGEPMVGRLPPFGPP